MSVRTVVVNFPVAYTEIAHDSLVVIELLDRPTGRYYEEYGEPVGNRSDTILHYIQYGHIIGIEDTPEGLATKLVVLYKSQTYVYPCKVVNNAELVELLL